MNIPHVIFGGLIGNIFALTIYFLWWRGRMIKEYGRWR